MAIDPTNYTPFDLSTLSSYYGSGASLDPSVLTAVFRAQINGGPTGTANAGTNGATGGSEKAPTDVVPPWLQPQALSPPTPTAQSVFQNSSQPLFNPSDPSLNRPDVTSDFKNLFALYQGLSQMKNLADFAANDPTASSMTSLLNNQFQTYLNQYYSYINGTSMQNVTLVAGLKQSTDTSTVKVPDPPSSYIGGFVTSNNDQPVPGLTYTEKFTITVTKEDGTTQSVPIDLSQVASTRTINDIADYINQQIGANGNIASSVAVSQNGIGSYSLQFFTAAGETISFQADPANQQPAVYVAGTSGGGDFAEGFVRKFQDLSNATPTQAFQQYISATQPASTAGTSSTSTPTVGNIVTSIDPTTGLPTATAAPSSGPPTQSAGVKTSGIAKDSNGNVYVVGTTDGGVGARITGGSDDVFLQKYDPSGKLVWTRDLGASGNAEGFAVTVDSNNNVIVAGQTTVPLTQNAMTSIDGATNTFVTKYDQSGQEVFTYESPTVASNSGVSVTTDAKGNIFVAGQVTGTISGSATAGGGADAYFSKLDPNGNVQYSQQFGNSAQQSAAAVQVDNAGHVFVLYNDNGQAKLSEYADAAGGSPIYDVTLGSVGSGAATGLALDGQGNVYVTGYSDGATLNGSAKNGFAGTQDGFVQQVNAQTGAVNYVSYLGGSGATQANAVAVNAGNVYVTGSTTAALPGATQVGAQDGFVATLNGATGALTQASQFGGSFGHTGNGIVVDPTGTSVLSRLGLPNGSAPGLVDPNGILVLNATSATAETAARQDQSLTITVNLQPKQTVTLGLNDSLLTLATNINQILGVNGNARVVNDGFNQTLQINATNGSKIAIGHGLAGFDLLGSLGLQAETLYGTPSTTPVQLDPANPLPTTPAPADPSVFQLGFINGLDLNNQKDANNASLIIANAMVQVKLAYQFLTQGPPPPPAPAAAPPSPELAKQISSYQDALTRLTAGGTSSTGLSSTLDVSSLIQPVVA
ncbi:MAG TPA: SBBP repeat-containing protein [Candidatus Cybelea sp.]|nr:SBBP repeat-containing protein [Candidatus Cybelea sp.]